MEYAADDFATIAQRWKEIAEQEQRAQQTNTCTRCCVGALGTSNGWAWNILTKGWLVCSACHNPDNRALPSYTGLSTPT